MNRIFRPLVLVALSVSLWAAPAVSDDPPKKLTPDDRKELEKKWDELLAEGRKAHATGKHAEAATATAKAVDLARRLYPATDFPDGHPKLAESMTNLAIVYKAQKKYADAEALYADALAMYKRLHKGDHPDTAACLRFFGNLYWDRAELAKAEPLYKDALAMFKRLHTGDHVDVAVSLLDLGALYRRQGKYAATEPLYREVLAMRRRLHPGDHPEVAMRQDALAALLYETGGYAEAERLFADGYEMRKRLYKGDHAELAISLSNLASMRKLRGDYPAAERLFRYSYEMRKRLHKGDHGDVARGLNNLAGVLRAQGKHTAAEGLYRDAVEMFGRLYPQGGHPDLAVAMNNLAGVLSEQGKHAAAEPLYKDALEQTWRYYKTDHPTVALGLNNLASVYQHQGKYADAEPLFHDALDMFRRLYPRQDHVQVAAGLNNLGMLYSLRNKHAEAVPLFTDALDMFRRLYKDHPATARCLNNLGEVYQALERYADAGRFYRDALAMQRRMVAAYAVQKSEGEALTLLASLPRVCDHFLSNARLADAEPAGVYAEVWATKGLVSRAFESRQQAARAAAADPKAAVLLSELTAARHARAELLLAPEVRDPDTRKKRQDEVHRLDKLIAERDEQLRPLLPSLARSERLAGTAPRDLQAALPADAAVVDFLRYGWSAKGVPGTDGKAVWRYLGFVVTRDRVAWVDLGAGADIDAAVAAWRTGITGGREIPAETPARVRELVWEKVRKALPAGTKTVYLCPDAALCKVPWAALPGDRPGTILLDDFAVAVIPHAPFMLDKLWPADERKTPTDRPADALVVGGVRYDAKVGPAANPAAGNPPVAPGANLRWAPLPNTVGEANGVAEAAGRKKLAVARLDGDKATAAAVLAALPKAKVAHFATHGFFADPSFRGLFRLDPDDYEQRGGERIGRAVNSPLVMTGVVLAGANEPTTPGRGILTGEQLIDLDLSGLELAVLSACETGLGDVAGGEGVYGLQRAFHYAGATNVVASVWKVPDQPTAALMALFYANLWDKRMTPIEALRQAQLEVYRNPGKIARWAKGFRGTFEEVGGDNVEAKPAKDGTAHPLLWAAFTLSGPGR